MYSRPVHLVVLKLLRTGKAEIIYNGPGGPPWEEARKMAKNGQRSISLTKLRALDKAVSDHERLSPNPTIA